MKNNKTILSGSVIASAILAVTGTNVNAASLTDFNTLGSGAEVRSTLLGNPTDAIDAYELHCGDHKTTDAKAKEATCGEKKDAKAKDAKCGEGKCGEHKKADAKTDGKVKEATCGEHKKADGKAKEATCGENKKATDAKSPK